MKCSKKGQYSMVSFRQTYRRKMVFSCIGLSSENSPANRMASPQIQRKFKVSIEIVITPLIGTSIFNM
jgi:hypothetical protein